MLDCRDRIVCPICGGWMESFDGDLYECDTCEHIIGGDVQEMEE